MDKSLIERLWAESHNLVHIGWVETDIMETDVINLGKTFLMKCHC